MIKKRKKFSWPKKIYDKNRIASEDKLAEKYGLKNKREIWKVEAKVRYFRNRAKDVITSPEEEKKKLFDKLNLIGLNVGSIADVLALNKENLLKRRLASVVVKRGLANTENQARQMISHKRVLVNGRVVSSPGYFVRVDEEPSISMKNHQKTEAEKA